MLTRDMDKARAWLRSQTRGSQKAGVLVSKAALYLNHWLLVS